MKVKTENLILMSLSILLARSMYPERIPTEQQKNTVQGLLKDIQTLVQENMNTSGKKKK
jgi:hypothetical protein